MNFKNTDIIVVNDPAYDFPLFRKFLIDHQHLFNKIHYVFSYNSTVWKNEYVNKKYDYSQIAIKTLPFANFLWSDHIDMIQNGRKDQLLTDFRDHAENVGLDASDSESVLFVEPDTRISNLDYLLNLPDTFDFVSHSVDYQLIMDPCLFWVKRSVIDKTKRWFTSTAQPLFSDMRYLTVDDESLPLADRLTLVREPHGADHFRKFNSEVLGITTNGHLFKSPKNDSWFRHYGGVIYAVSSYRQGRYFNGSKSLFHGSVINDMVERSMNCGVEMDQRYVDEWKNHFDNIRRLQPDLELPI